MFHWKLSFRRGHWSRFPGRLSDRPCRSPASHCNTHAFQCISLQ
ncbi:hypothetical protein B4135_3796 [Caldibacillus debilis]|uniref:Uncharacterized protein n=1 Tax=Caldibacillus debilis TaxID=301148 RepID=A0A150LCL1_9BACI|nr:hypothetical protein B4135_3796 [Caldibacillus debilis]